MCRKANQKLNKEMCYFRCASSPFIGKVKSWDASSPDPRKLKALIDMPPPKCTKELKSLLHMIKYLSKFLPSTADVC